MTKDQPNYNKVEVQERNSKDVVNLKIRNHGKIKN